MIIKIMIAIAYLSVGGFWMGVFFRAHDTSSIVLEIVDQLSWVFFWPARLVVRAGERVGTYLHPQDRERRQLAALTTERDALLKEVQGLRTERAERGGFRPGGEAKCGFDGNIGDG